MSKSSFYSGTGLTNNDQNAIDGAKNAAEAAQVAAEAARDRAVEAEGNAASDAADIASNVTAAQTAATTATGASQDAVDARDLSLSYRNAAQAAEGGAEAAQLAAESARDDAQTAQGAAESARDTAQGASTSATQALTDFRSHYIGPSATVPTNDGNGDPLSNGDMYFDTQQGALFVYNSSTSSFERTASNTDATQTTAGRMSAADKTKLDGIDTSADVTDATTVEASGALMDSELTSEASVKAIDQGLATTDGPTFNDLSLTTYANLTPIAHPTHQEGRVFYDSEHKTLGYYSDITNVTHEIGIEEHQRVYNNTGSTIAKGAPLYFSGNYTAGSIDVPTVGLADATDVGAYNAQGLAAHDIPSGSYGYCLIAGQLHGVDTSGLSANTNFFVGLTPGAVQNASPTYPNFPMCLGWVVKSDATNGVLLVNQQNHSVNSFRVRTSAHVGSDLQVDGDLTVLGTTTSVSTADVTAGAPFYRANEGDAIGEAGTTFTGTGLDDAFFAGHFTGTTPTTYYVKIDSVGTPDTFAVSTDNFATTISTGNAITGSEQMIHSADNISVTFGATTGHTLNDVWTGTASPVNVDSGFFTNFNTGTTGTGYTHTGFFYDASEAKWTLLNEYDPVPAGAIDLADASVVYGTLKASSFEGDLLGNLSGPTSVSGTLTVDAGSELNGDVNINSTASTERNLTMVGPTGSDTLNNTSLTSGDILMEGGSLKFKEAILGFANVDGQFQTFISAWGTTNTNTEITKTSIYTPTYICDATQGLKWDTPSGQTPWGGPTWVRHEGNTQSGTSTYQVINFPRDHSGTLQTQGRSIAMALILG